MFGRKRKVGPATAPAEIDLRDPVTRDRFIFGDGERRSRETRAVEFLLFGMVYRGL